jgi:hypothetical protein
MVFTEVWAIEYVIPYPTSFSGSGSIYQSRVYYYKPLAWKKSYSDVSEAKTT